MVKNYGLQQACRSQKSRREQVGREPDYLSFCPSLQLFDKPSHDVYAERSGQGWKQPYCQQGISPDGGVYPGNKGQQRGGTKIAPVQMPRLSQIEVGVALETVIGGCKQVSQELDKREGKNDKVCLNPCF